MAEENGVEEAERLYLGVDVGGTKVQSSLVKESGKILCSERCPTPRECEAEQTLAAIEQAIADVLAKAERPVSDVTAMGIAIPGVVDPDRGHIVVTPNMNLTDVAIGPHLSGRFDMPVAIGNDCNLGALGETWRGSARHAQSTVAILVGTGIGGGYVQSGKLWRGARESAGEIGHIVMQVGGPKCGCGNCGCLEALASRTAIERDIRQAIAEGRETILSELTGGDLSIVRSGMLRRSLEADDEVVTEVMRYASEVIGHACLTVRHLIDPEVIVLGGGVMEACSDFMLPIVQDIVRSDALPGARPGGRVTLSGLGDDAVVVGAVALARTAVGRNPLKKRSVIQHPRIESVSFGQIVVGDKTYSHDIWIRANGKVKTRDKELARQHHGSSHQLGPKELRKVCKGGPEVIFIGSGMSGGLQLTEDAQDFLKQRAIQVEILPTSEIAEAYNESTRLKAAVIHVTC